MEKGSIVLFLSVPQSTAKEEKYIGPDGETYSGISTNDAPCCYLLREAMNNGIEISEIICIVTKSSKPSLKDFECRTRKQAKNKGIPQDFVIKQIEFDENSTNYSKLLKDVSDTVTTKKVYIESTGGFRDVAFYIISIIKYLKLKGISCQDVVYSGFYIEPKRMYSIDYLADFFDIVSGVYEFSSTAYARNMKLLADKVGDKDFEKIADSIIGFTDELTIGRVTNVESKLKAIRESIDGYKKKKDKTSVYALLFKRMIPLIRQGMYLDRIFRSNEINYPELLSWCFDHGMLQQCLTLYVEKIPQYYLKNNSDIKNYYAERVNNSDDATNCRAIYYIDFDKSNNINNNPNYFDDFDFKEFRKEINLVKERTKPDKEAVEECIKLLNDKALKKKNEQYKRLAVMVNKIYTGETIEYKKNTISIELLNIYNMLLNRQLGYSDYWSLLHYLVYNNEKIYVGKSSKNIEKKKRTKKEYTAFIESIKKDGIDIILIKLMENYLDNFKANSKSMQYEEQLERLSNLAKQVINARKDDEILFYDISLGKMQKQLGKHVIPISLFCDEKTNFNLNMALTHYILYANEDEYQQLCQEVAEKKDITNGEAKKLIYLDSIKNDVSNDFYNKMLYYILINYYRNRIIHDTRGSSSQKLGKQMEDIMRENNIKIPLVDFSFNDLRDLAEKAIEIAKV